MREPFVAAPQWNGSKPGYYFAAGSEGVGYYLDNQAATSSDAVPKKRRRIQFDESRNETRSIPSADDLLAQAEAAAAGRPTISLTTAGVATASRVLSQALAANTTQRNKFTDDPSKYMDSEVTLYEHVASWGALAVRPDLWPNDTVFLELLQHENADLATAVVTVWLEWMDPVALFTDTDDGVVVPPASALNVAGRIVQEGAEYLVGNLGRLSASETGNTDQVGNGSADILKLLENLMEIDELVAVHTDRAGLVDNDDVASTALSLTSETGLLSWLLQVVDGGSLAGRALELLAVLSPREEIFAKENLDWTTLPSFVSLLTDESGSGGKTIDGVEILLQIVGKHRKRQPEDTEQCEILENACIVLASALAYSEANTQAFVDGQGIELVVRCLKEKVHAGGVGLKLLDFSGNLATHKRACEHMVKAGILKYIFPLWLGRYVPKMANLSHNSSLSKKALRSWTHTLADTAGRILYALIKHLDATSPDDAQARLLSKFDSDECCGRLATLCLSYDQKSRKAEFEFYQNNDDEESMDEGQESLAALEAKLSGGGDVLHRLSALAAFCCTGSKRCHGRILSLLQAKQSGMSLVRDSLEEFVSVLDDSEHKTELRRYLDCL